MKKEFVLKLTIFDVLCFLIAFLSLSTNLQGALPFSVNRAITLLIVEIIVVHELLHLKSVTYILGLYIIFVFIYSFLWSKDLSQNINDYLYFAIALLEMNFFADEQNLRKVSSSFKKHRTFILLIAILDLFVILYSLMDENCYIVHWGEGEYFKGYTISPHVVAAGCCLVMTIWILWLSNCTFSFLHFLPLVIILYAILKTGARVFLVPPLILVAYYLKNRIKNRNLRWTVYGVGGGAFGYFFINSSMMEKMIYSAEGLTEESLLYKFTSGRSKFWMIDIEDYMNNDFIQQMFGNGFDYIYNLHLEKYYIAIWAHNDYINILVACGLVGLLIYIFMTKRVLSPYMKDLDVLNKMMIVLYVVFPAFINGFYTYYHYFTSLFVFLIVIEMIKDTSERIEIG